MAECKTCIHEAVCEKAKHVENHHIQGCRHYKDKGDVIDTLKRVLKKQKDDSYLYCNDYGQPIGGEVE